MILWTNMWVEISLNFYRWIQSPYIKEQSCLNEAIKPETRDKYNKGKNGFCIDADIDADTEYRWIPRTCCEKHASYDKRTPGLFKLEYSGDKNIVAAVRHTLYGNT